MHFVLMAPAIWLQLKPGSQHGRVMRPGAPHSAYEAVHIAAMHFLTPPPPGTSLQLKPGAQHGRGMLPPGAP